MGLRAQKYNNLNKEEKKIRKFDNYSQVFVIFAALKNNRMNISFDDNALEELYTKGVTNDRKYKKLSQDVIKQYIKTVNFIKAVTRVEDLYSIKSLHYEKKKGDLKGIEVVWINTQYRLHFQSSPDESGIVVNALLIEISKHYE